MPLAWRLARQLACRLAFWAALAVTAVLALLPQPPELGAVESDKLQHLLAFAVLSLLGVFAHPRLPRLRLALGLAGFGAAIELAQLIPALNRSGDPLDWAADVAAIAVAVPAAALLQRRLARPSAGSG